MGSNKVLNLEWVKSMGKIMELSLIILHFAGFSEKDYTRKFSKKFSEKYRIKEEL